MGKKRELKIKLGTGVGEDKYGVRSTDLKVIGDDKLKNRYIKV